MATSCRLLTILGLFLSLGRAAIVHSGQQVLSSGKSTISAAKKLEHVRKQLHKAEIIPTVIDNFIPSLLVEAKWDDKYHADLGNTLKPKHLEDAPKIHLHNPSSHHGKKHDAPNSGCWTTDSNSHHHAVPKANYVFALTDPDAPSRDDPKWSEFCHWIALWPYEKDSSNQAGCLEDEAGSVKGLDLDEIMEYKPPSPPEDTGKHRYVLLVFVPANATTEKIYPSKPEDRKHWGYDVDDDGLDEEEGASWWAWNWSGRRDKAQAAETPGVRRWARENGLVAVGANFIYAEHE
ncbi:lipid binding protein [Rhypophila sp. PSN 637]